MHFLHEVCVLFIFRLAGFLLLLVLLLSSHHLVVLLLLVVVAVGEALRPLLDALLLPGVLPLDPEVCGHEPRHVAAQVPHHGRALYHGVSLGCRRQLGLGRHHAQRARQRGGAGLLHARGRPGRGADTRRRLAWPHRRGDSGWRPTWGIIF